MEPDFEELFREALNGGAPVERKEGELLLEIELRGSTRTEVRNG